MCDSGQKDKKKNRKMTLSQMKKSEMNRQMNHYNKMQSIHEKCKLCYGEKIRISNVLISIGTLAYLKLKEDYIVTGHCLIVPMDHISSIRLADESTLTEIRNFKKSLIQMFQKQVMLS